MPGSASVESRRLTRRPSRANSRSDDGRGCWRQALLSLTWLLCCIKPTSEDAEQQAENDFDLDYITSTQKASEVHQVCDENDQLDPNKNDGEINGKSNPKRNASDEPKLPLKQRFLNVFRRKSNKVGPLEVKSSDGPTGENPQEQNDSDCDAASQVDLEDKPSSSVHDNTKLTPNVSAEPQCPSRSSSEIDMSLMCNAVVNTAIRNTINAITEESSSSEHAYGPVAAQPTAKKTPSPSAGAVHRSQSLGDVSTARGQNKPSPPRVRRTHSETHLADDCLDQNFLEKLTKTNTPFKANDVEDSVNIKRSQSLNDIATESSDSSALCVSHSRSDECIMTAPVNKRLQGLKTGLRHSQASLDLLAQ